MFAASGALELQRPNVCHLGDALLRSDDSGWGLELLKVPSEAASQHRGWLRNPPEMCIDWASPEKLDA
eukprot:3139797-Alexandrium_andersonii.AAC.1